LIAKWLLLNKKTSWMYLKDWQDIC
jgi:hypothetical protein